MSTATDTSTTAVVPIDFGAIAGTTGPEKGPADAALTKIASGGSLQTLSCRSVLDADQLEQVKAIAQRQYPVMLEDRNQLAEFGSSSLDGVNACVSRMLKAQKDLQIPEVKQFTREMDDAVSGFQRKWDPKSEAVMAKFEGMGRFMSGLFAQGRTLLEDMYKDSQSVEKRLDGIAGKLVERKQQLDTNVAFCDELYAQNEAAIMQLMGVVSILEQIRDESVDHAKRLREEINGIDASSPDHRTKEEELSNVTEFLGDIEIQINEYIQQLYLSWTTSPQIRNIRKISYGLSSRLRLLVKQTIPALKRTIAVWGTLLQAEQAGTAISAVNDVNNKALTMLADAAAVSVPQLASVMQNPSIRPETIMAIAQSIIAQNKGLEEAVVQGQQQRAQVVDAIVTASQAASQSGAELNDTVVKLVAQSQRKLELPPAPVVPEVVLAA